MGEASPMYLYVPGTAERIKRYVPDAKLVAVLRDPVERAYSSYLHLVRDGRESLDFARALEEEEARIRDGWHPLWHYKNRGFYHAQLARYYGTFGPEQIRVFLYEDLSGDPVGVLQDVFRFLDVDASFVPDTSLRHNASGVPKSRALHALVNKPNPLKAALKPLLPKGLRRRAKVNLGNCNLAKAPLPEDVRVRLAEAYREDVTKLESFIRRDLSGWLAG